MYTMNIDSKIYKVPIPISTLIHKYQSNNGDMLVYVDTGIVDVEERICELQQTLEELKVLRSYLKLNKHQKDLWNYTDRNYYKIKEQSRDKKYCIVKNVDEYYFTDEKKDIKDDEILYLL